MYSSVAARGLVAGNTIEVMANYRHLEVEVFVGEPTAAELAAIEQKLGAKLPTDFVSFLQVGNGGYLPYLVDVPFDDTDQIEVLSFCGLYGTRSRRPSQKDRETFLVEIDAERIYKKIPLEVLPIARDGGSSILFLDLTPEGAGRVIAFVDGLPAWTGSRQNSAFVELAKNFTEFVDKLYLEPEN